MKDENTMTKVREEKKREIIAKASRLFMERGIYEVSMGDLAQYCEVGVASLYRYFGTKNALVVKCGAYVWECLGNYFAEKRMAEQLERENGRGQMEENLKIFLNLYRDMSQELCFVHDFDTFVWKQKIDKGEIADYEACVEEFYGTFQAVYRLGEADGSVSIRDDGEHMFLTIVHTLFCLNQKFAQGEIMSRDNDSRSQYELRIIIDLFRTQI